MGRIACPKTAKFWDLFAKTGANSQIVQSRVVACEPQTGV